MSHSKIENKGLDIINSGLAEFISHPTLVDELINEPTFESFKNTFLNIITE